MQLILRPYQHSDLENLVKHANNFNISKYLTNKFPFPYEKKDGEAFIQLIYEANERGFPVRNCYLCKYQGRNWSLDSDDPIFCKITKTTCGSNAAADCTYFRKVPSGRGE